MAVSYTHLFYMFEDIKKHIKDWKDDEEIEDYLEKILEKQTFDRMGDVYKRQIYGRRDSPHYRGQPCSCCLS